MNAISLFIFTSQWCKGAHVSRFNGQNYFSDKNYFFGAIRPLQNVLYRITFTVANLKFQSGVSCIFPWILQPTKGTLPLPTYNPQREVSWALLYLFDHIWDSVVQFRPLEKGLCHPSSSFLSIPLLPQPLDLSMRFTDESFTVGVRTLLFCGKFSVQVLCYWTLNFCGCGFILFICTVAIAAHQSVGWLTVLL